MNSLKRLGVFLLVATLLVLVSVGFKGKDIHDRAIIVGLGIDLVDGQIEVTAEVISPGNGSEQVGTYSKTVSATGKTLAQAVQNTSQLTGKEASLGQCVLLVFGEQLVARQNLGQLLEFFVKSDSFKETATVCCCKGTAKQLFESVEALSGSVSLSLSAMMQSQAKEIAIPTTNLLSFARSQRELLQTGFLNYVETVSTNNQSSNNQSKPQVYFVYDKVAVFAKHQFVCLLSQSQTVGFSLLKNNVSGNMFVVQHNGNDVALRSDQKDLSVTFKNGVAHFSVTLKLQLAQTDNFGQNNSFVVKNNRQIPQELLDQVQLEAQALVNDFWQMQTQYNFDIVGLHELLRSKFGTNSNLCCLPMQQIAVEFSISAQEK